MDKKAFKWLLGLIGVFLVIGLLTGGNFSANSQNASTTNPAASAAQNQKPIEVSYDQILNDIQNDSPNISKVTLTKTGPLSQVNEVTVERKNAAPEHAIVPGEAGNTRLLDAASKTGVKVEAKDDSAQSGGSSILGTILGWLPMILIFGFIFWMMRKAAGGPRAQMGRFGEAPAKQAPPLSKVTFKDVAGCENAKRELMEVVDYLKNPGLLASLGGKPIRGVLLVGPPGNGKTLLAKAVAGEAGANFFAVSGSDFVEMFVGVGASRVRDLFNKGKQNTPSIIFIDEIDAVGRQRGTGLGGGNDEREQTLNQILVEMDGFGTIPGVIVMAATNRADILDPALVRPGRFDLQVLVDQADVNGRLAILKIHTRDKKLAPDVDLAQLAATTPGLSGAELSGAANQAAIVAARRISDTVKAMRAEGKSEQEIATAVPQHITMQDFDEGVTRVQMGPASGKVMSKEDLENTAYHELGHAYVSQVMFNENRGGDPVTKITIIPRARALGYTQSLPKGDRYNYTKDNLRARIMMAMGGRAAQEIFLNTVDTGASNDFEQATNIARQMVTKFGMSELGPISVGDPGANPFLGRAMASEVTISASLQSKIDDQWMKIVNECYAETKALIERDRACFKHIADILLEQETILGPQWEQLFNESTCQQRKIRKIELPADQVAEEPCDTCGQPDAQTGGEPLAHRILDAINPAHLLKGLRGKDHNDQSEGKDGEKK